MTMSGPTLYLGASLAFERTTEHKSFRIPGTPVSSVNTGWEASEISIRDSIRSATKLDNFCGLERRFLLLFAPLRHATVASPACVVNWTVYRSCVTAHPSSPRPVRRTGATAEGRRGVCAVSRSRARVSRCARGVAAGFAVPGLSKTLVRAPRAGDPAGGVGCASAYGLRS